MKTIMPRAFAAFVLAVVKSIEGLALLGELLEVKSNTEALVRRDLDRAQTAYNEYREAITAALSATQVQQTVDAQAYEYISFARDVLKRKISPQYTEEWGEAGFINKTLRVPRTLNGRLNALKTLEMYFKAHPDAQVEALSITQERAAQLHGLLVDGIAGANKAKSLQRQKRAARNAAVYALRRRMQALRAELKFLLAKDDPDWLVFGFHAPADVSVPEAPKELTVTTDEAGEKTASWKAPANTDRYRVYEQMVGRDEEYVLVATVTETSMKLGLYASGTHVKWKVTAVNRAGEGRGCEVEMVT